MAMAAIVAASVLLLLTGETKGNPHVKNFWRPALSCTLASPFGYWSLSYISYPLLLLAKSCKLVPVMLVGVVMLGRRHTRAEYVAVGLITVGVALFSIKPGAFQDAGGGGSSGGINNVLGLALVSVNLILDGVTNAEQDRINGRFKAPGSYMMLAINLWILFFHLVYLGGSWAVFGADSELAQALDFMGTFPEVIKNVAAFCACAGMGQLFVFFIIKEFGSLVNVTVTISRKFFSILISVVVFGHSVAWWQWVGVLCVFSGLTLSVRAKYAAKKGRVETIPVGAKGGVGTSGARVLAATRSAGSFSTGAAAADGASDKKKEL